MKKAAIVFFPFVFVALFAFAFSVYGANLQAKVFPVSGRFEELKWGSSEASVRASLSARKIKVSESTPIAPHGATGVRFQEPEARTVYGRSTDMGILYAFIDNHLVVVTIGFTLKPAETGEFIKQLKDSYRLADAVSPSDSLVITDFESDSGHVIVFMAISEDRKSVAVQMIFMAEQEYKQTIGKKKKDTTPDSKPLTPETVLPKINLGL